LKNFLKYALSAVIMIAFLYWAFRGTDFPALVVSFRSVNYWWMPVMIFCLLLSNFFRAWRWRYLLDPIKSGLSLGSLFSGVMIGYFVNNLIPRAGEIVRPFVVARKHQIPTSAVLGTVATERLLDMMTLLFILLLLPVMYDGPLRESFPWLDRSAKVTALLLLVLFLVIGVMMARRDVTARLLRMLTSLLPANVSEKVIRIAESFLDGFLFVKRPSTFFSISVSSILIWMMYVLMHYAALQAFHLEELLGFRGAVIILGISTIGVVLPTPGATGTYHFFVMQALVLLYKVSSATALSYATVTHGTTFVSVTIIGAYFLIRDRVNIGKVLASQEERES
jgi:glycosyltransferase 2 family protein